MKRRKADFVACFDANERIAYEFLKQNRYQKADMIHFGMNFSDHHLVTSFLNKCTSVRLGTMFSNQADAFHQKESCPGRYS
jgi:hypothetical protein